MPLKLYSVMALKNIYKKANIIKLIRKTQIVFSFMVELQSIQRRIVPSVNLYKSPNNLSLWYIL